MPKEPNASSTLTRKAPQSLQHITGLLNPYYYFRMAFRNWLQKTPMSTVQRMQPSQTWLRCNSIVPFWGKWVKKTLFFGADYFWPTWTLQGLWLFYIFWISKSSLSFLLILPVSPRVFTEQSFVPVAGLRNAGFCETLPLREPRAWPPCHCSNQDWTEHPATMALHFPITKQLSWDQTLS